VPQSENDYRILGLIASPEGAQIQVRDGSGWATVGWVRSARGKATAVDSAGIWPEVRGSDEDLDSLIRKFIQGVDKDSKT
jgi:hypothetical protein